MADLSPEARRERLEQHVNDTYPETTADFLGREHFWALGEEVGEERRYSGKLFTEIAFPIRGNPHAWRELREIEKIEPESVGLVLRRRIDIDMPLPPIQLTTTTTTPAAVMAHIDIGYVDPNANRKAMTERVVQMQGVIDLGCDPNQHGVSLTPRSLQAFVAMLPRMMEFPQG